MHLCRLLFIGKEDWNLHASFATGRPLNSDRWFFQISHILCSAGQMDVGVYGIKCLKTNTFQQLPEGSKLEVGALWSKKCFLDAFIVVKSTIDKYKYVAALVDLFHPYMRIIFPQKDGIYQQNTDICHTARRVHAWFEEHQDEFIILPWSEILRI